MFINDKDINNHKKNDSSMSFETDTNTRSICADFNPDQLLRDFEYRLDNQYCTELNKAGSLEIHAALTDAVMHVLTGPWRQCSEHRDISRKACYLSAEFLVGRAIFNNLYNLKLLDDVSEWLKARNVDIRMLEEVEDDALGNGGLGRLAACFMESAATHGIPLKGYGIRYRYGLFKQIFVNGYQKEAPDDWTVWGDHWSLRRDNQRVKVNFANQTVWAIPYDMPIIGYAGKFINTLRLWQSEAVEPFDFDSFNHQEYRKAVSEQHKAEAISMVLFPNDDRRAGKKLRLKQQYFFSSATVQDILREFRENHGPDLTQLPMHTTIQLNDTHPVIAIPELIRLLMKDGIEFGKALNIARETFAYTNHTIMAEALETWDTALVRELIPEVWQIIRKIQQHAANELAEPGKDKIDYESLLPIDHGKVHMARIAVYLSRSINGVAQLHTDLLKSQLFRHWYRLYPDRFNNKTNGITQRRWFGLCNRIMADWVTSLIGDGWLVDLNKIKAMEVFADDIALCRQFNVLKYLKKEQLCSLLERKEGILISPDRIFDVQIKRLHEYKRQLLNALCIIHFYSGIKNGTIQDFPPTVFLFAAKAAPGYFRAKAIIKLINAVAEMVNNDPMISPYMQVVFVPNYNVSWAEAIIPAADISEQISMAGTEASGTGNMKLMLNGAVTLGTYDGANVEIIRQAGMKNNYIFGATVEEVSTIKENYRPKQLMQKYKSLKHVLSTLVDGTLDDGGTGMFRELYDSLIVGVDWHSPDHYLVLQDFESYVKARLRALRDYTDRTAFASKCIRNMANSGWFSSDRTISEYASEIWKVSLNERSE